MWIYWILVAAVGILLIFSSGTEPEEEVRWYREPFQKGARYLAEKWSRQTGRGDPGRESQKLEQMLIFLVLGLVMLPFLEGISGSREIPLTSYQLERPEKGEGSSSYELQARLQDREETQDIHLDVQERQYSDEEKEAILKAAKEEIDRLVPGENLSPDEVRGRVILPTELQNGAVTVQWTQDPVDLLDEDGTIIEPLPEQGKILTLTALLTCEDKEEWYERALHLYPALRTEEEQLQYELNMALKSAQEESIDRTTVVLPETVQGRNVTWMEKRSSMIWLWLILVIVGAAAGYMGKEEEFRKREEERKRQLILDYPDVVFKMGMLLNAGLTIQNAFTRIAGEYQETRREDHIRWAYEEMTVACNEMNSGIPEARAYERFGRRCGQTCYVRLGTMLSGSLQKSSEGMTKLLLDEAEEAMEERRQLARKMGEEAGTKLLFPMILMLMVVLVILIVPAVLSF